MNFGIIISKSAEEGGIDTTSAFYTDAMIERNVNVAHQWAAAYHKWPFTEYMDKSGAFVSGVEENAYPNAGFKTDSIRMLKVGSSLFKKTDFSSYQQWREDHPTNTDKIFSDYGRVLYINPNCVSGTIYAFAQLTPIDFAAATTASVFSGYDEEGDEAIVNKTISILLKRQKQLTQSADFENRAKQTLEELWQRIKDEQAMYQTKDQSLFEDFNIIDEGEEENPLRFE